MPAGALMPGAEPNPPPSLYEVCKKPPYRSAENFIGESGTLPGNCTLPSVVVKYQYRPPRPTLHCGVTAYERMASN